MFRRDLIIHNERSFFLFGARGTGKTTFLRQTFGDAATWIDLLDPAWERRLLRTPEALLSEIERLIKNDGEWLVIDEIQKIPALLDVVHSSLSRQSRIKFALTGSSARKLKRGGANLLAGRAITYPLHPLTHRELGEEFDLDKVLRWGSLPEAATINDPTLRDLYLESYCSTYLKEEVYAEQLTRKIIPFRLFLEVAAQENGHVLNFDKIGRDVGVNGKTIATYFDILQDTWLGFILPPTHESLRKKQRSSPKFYLFDVGVARALSGTLDVVPKPRTNMYGDLFEHFIVVEALRLNSYAHTGFIPSYFAAHGGIEIDLVLEKPRRPSIFIEIKSTTSIDERDIAPLRKIHQERPSARCYCLSRDTHRREVDGVQIVFWQEGLNEIFLQAGHG